MTNNKRILKTVRLANWGVKDCGTAKLSAVVSSRRQKLGEFVALIAK